VRRELPVGGLIIEVPVKLRVCTGVQAVPLLEADVFAHFAPPSPVLSTLPSPVTIVAMF